MRTAQRLCKKPKYKYNFLFIRLVHMIKITSRGITVILSQTKYDK